MKRKLLLAGTLAGLFAFTQKVEAQSISVGPRLGINFATTAIKDADAEQEKEFDEDRTSYPGMNLGAVVNIGINDMFSIQPELLFSQKGIKNKGSYKTLNDEGKEVSEDYEDMTRINYLEIPVLAKVSFGSDNMKFFVNAGPYAAIGLGGKNKWEAGNESEEEDIEFGLGDKETDDNYYSGFKRFDAGLALGAGVGFKAGSGMLNLEARYGLGLSDLREYRESDNKTNYSNRVFGISLSYMFEMGK